MTALSPAAGEPIAPEQLCIVPANEVSWADLRYRRRGITYALAAATVSYARDRGARALEGYPMIVPPGKEITWGELHVGSRQVFADAGFAEVSHPSPWRVVMRINFEN